MKQTSTIQHLASPLHLYFQSNLRSARLTGALLLALAFSPLFTSAQTPQPWELGGGVGVASYQGDLDKFMVNTALRRVNPAFSLHVRRYANNLFALRGSVLGGRLTGDESHFAEPAWRRERGVSFNSMLWEAKAGVEFYPFGQYTENTTGSALEQPYGTVRRFMVKANGDTVITAAHRRKFAPYIFLGGGLAYSKPKVDWNESDAELGNPSVSHDMIALDHAARYSDLKPVLPVGAGVRIPLSSKALLGIEGLFHYTFTDYLDGVSNAGNPGKKDWYFIGQVSVSWPIGQSDRDHDGIADQQDHCPSMPGTVAAGGCPDADHDGVANHLDACPDIAGATSLRGCPDSDQDGVADKDDLCPQLSGKGAANGCPANSMPNLNLTYKVVYFDPAADAWLPTSQLTLDEAAAFLQKNPSYSARIEGSAIHTDNAAANGSLSTARAQRCADYLTAKGIAANRLTFTGFGDKRPIASNSIAEGRRLNNRVEVYFFQK